MSNKGRESMAFSGEVQFWRGKENTELWIEQVSFQ